MLINEAIAFTEQELKKSNNLNSRLDSEILVSHLINIPRESIYSKLKENLSSSKAEELQKLINRRVNKEPIAYILNKKVSTSFCSPKICIPSRTVGTQSNRLLLRQANRIYYSSCHDPYNKANLNINLVLWSILYQ